jgi:hypothetical protein
LCAKQHCTQRCEGVVGYFARPHQIPERSEQFRIRCAAYTGTELAPKARTTLCERSANLVVHTALRCFEWFQCRKKGTELIGEEQADSSVVAAE